MLNKFYGLLIAVFLLINGVVTAPLAAESVLADVDFISGMPEYRYDGSIMGINLTRPLVKSQSTSVTTAGAHNTKAVSYVDREGYRMTRNVFGNGFIRVSFVKEASMTGPIALQLTHFSDFPVLIMVNDHVIEPSYIANGSRWILDHWEITPYIVEGINQVSIEAIDDYISKPKHKHWYYISSLRVLEVESPFGRYQQTEMEVENPLH